MEDNFIIIAVTPPDAIADEAKKITRLLSSGAVDIVHLRHPGATLKQMRDIIEAIPQPLHGRIRLHGHFSLIDEFNLAGPHLNSRCPQWNRTVATSCNDRWHPTLSRTCHTPEEVEAADGCAYVTLSPIYPSISKPGYTATFSEAQLTRCLAANRVVALGGVTPDKFAQLRRRGFAGAAMLGYVWEGDLEKKIRTIRMMRAFGLQYITNGATPCEVEAEVKAVLAGGCRWVQLRMKDAGVSTIIDTINLIRPLCRHANAILLIDDHAELVIPHRLDGVHLGKNDMSPSEARKIVGNNAIIGSTANTYADILAIESLGQSDYIGLGPLRFTTTKKNLSPTLGIEGYRAIFSNPVQLPVVAIGSVALSDVGPLIEAGASGVAVSGSIRNAADPAATTAAFISALHDTSTESTTQHQIND